MDHTFCYIGTEFHPLQLVEDHENKRRLVLNRLLNILFHKWITLPFYINIEINNLYNDYNAKETTKQQKTILI